MTYDDHDTVRHHRGVIAASFDANTADTVELLNAIWKAGDELAEQLRLFHPRSEQLKAWRKLREKVGT